MDFLEKYGLKEGGKVTLEKKYEVIPTPLPSVVHMIIRRPCRYL